MTFTFWRCKRLTKRIWKLEAKKKWYQDCIKTLDKWIKIDRTMLNKNLKLMSRKEFIQYGMEMGLLDNEDYKIIERQKGILSIKNKKR